MNQIVNKKVTYGVVVFYTVISSLFILYHLRGWLFYVEYNNGETFFWQWVRLLISITILYNAIRVYDFIYNIGEVEQRQFKKLYFRTILVVSLLFSPAIIHYLFTESIIYWAEKGFSDESSTNIVLRILKTMLGVIIMIFFEAYEFIRQIVIGALEEIDYTFFYIPNEKGEPVGITAANAPLLSYVLAGVIMYWTIRYRNTILAISGYTYKIGVWLKNIIFGRDTDIMSKGIVRTAMGKLSWLKRLFFFLLGIKITQKDTSRGTATWAKKSQVADIASQKESGLLIDGVKRISWKDSMSHIAVLAPSGKGKTASYVIPNVFGITEFINPASGTSASLVITDPKGEIFETTSKYLEDQGYTVKVINVEEPLRSEHFNPVKRATTDREIAKLAQILVGSGISDTKNNNKDFWGQAAEMLLTLVIKIVKRSNVPDEHQNLHNIRHFVDLMGGDGKPIASFVQKHCIDTQVITEYASFIQQDSETLSNIIITVKTILKDLSIKEIAQLTGDDTVNFELLRREKTAVFIITPFSDIEYYRFFLTILYSQLFSYCDKNSKGNDIVFMLDEFGNLGRIPSFDKLITTLRSKRCSISIILQDIEQLRKTYGNSDAKTILNGGCSSKIFFGGIQNLDTLKEVSQMLGNQTISQKSKEGRDMGTIARPLMMPDEISRMEIGTAILLSSGRLPVKLKLQKFDDTKLNERLHRDEYGDLLAVDLPTYNNTTVDYFPFDNYIDNMVED